MNRLKNINKNGITLYTIAFFLISIGIFGVFYLRSFSFVSEFDGIGQHYPMLIELREIILSRLKDPLKPIQFWTWNLGIGSDVIHSMSYYGLGDIISYLIIFFPLKHLEFGYGFLMILRMYLAGIALIFYLKKYQYSSIVNSFSAIFYAFCGVLLMFVHPFFANPLILLPLILIAIDKIFEGKSGRMFIWVVAYTLINNFYFAYMLMIMSIFYAVLQYIFIYKNKVNFWKMFFKLAMNGLISFLISSILFIPSVLGMLQSTRSDSPFANGVHLYPISYYLKLIPGLFGPVDYLPYSTKLAFASIVIYAIMYIFLNRKRYKILFISLLCSFVLLLFPYGAAVMNGFSSPANRWAFGLSFILAISVAHFMGNLKQLTVKELKTYMISFFVCIAIYWIHPNYNWYSKEMMLPLLFLSINLFLIVLTYIQKREKIFSFQLPKIFFIILCMNVLTTGNYYFSNLGSGASDNRRQSNTINESITDQYQGLENKFDDKTFYRISPVVQDSTYNLEQVNNSIIRNTNEVASYLSVQNGYIGEFSRLLKNNQFTMTNPLKQVDGRTVLTNYLGVKYMLATEEDKNYTPYQYKNVNTTKSEMSVYESEYALPIAFMNYDTISLASYNKLTENEKEDYLIRGVVTDTTVNSNNEAEKIAEYEELDFESNDIVENNFKINKNKKEYTIKLTDPEKTIGKEIYLKIDGLSYTSTTFLERWQEEKKDGIQRRTTYNFFRNNLGVHYSDGYNLNFSTETNTNSIKQYSKYDPSSYDPKEDFLIHLGYSQSEQPIIKIKANDLGSFSFENMKIIVKEFNKGYSNQIKKLQRQKLENIEFTNNQLRGTVSSVKEGYLVTSIPYSNGWKVYVDGELAETERANIGFLSTKLKTGYHTVEFVYKTPAFQYAATFTAIGLLLWVATEIIWFYKKD